MVKIASRFNEFSYAIRDMAAEAAKIKASGMKLYPLNIGDPVIGEFQTPDYVKQALSDAVFAGKNYYEESLGVLELREEILKREQRRNGIDLPVDNILVTQGVSEAIFFAMAALCEQGLEILLPGPVYSPYQSYANFFEGKAVEYKLDEEDDWNPDVDDIRKKISDKTNAILISSPNNPTGGLTRDSTLREIINIAGEFDLPVISDEIYDELIFEGDYTCPASIANDVPIIGMNGFSKAHLATGWRLGYVYFYDPLEKITDVRLAMEKLARVRLCANTPVQWAAIKLLQDPGVHTQDMVNRLRVRRDYTYKRLTGIDSFTCVLPRGAFYAFPKIDLRSRWLDDKEFCMDLLRETGIVTVFGSGFGDLGRDHFRVVFLPPMPMLQEVYDLLEDFMANHP
ncbi:MAG TPA: aminotransferase class I/II-fold pyridoxal phosphate-dependent enzyme [Candidatus Lokiarchaeia archaeon]|nr:aminotransferase class I/II-fold pyridoxal phosphate-dependent enzyme [Candidatus Lokiarchaeia archaeon]